eukprot:1170988-Rhodomonas_salina.1
MSTHTPTYFSTPPLLSSLPPAPLRPPCPASCPAEPLPCRSAQGFPATRTPAPAAAARPLLWPRRCRPGQSTTHPPIPARERACLRSVEARRRWSFCGPAVCPRRGSGGRRSPCATRGACRRHARAPPPRAEPSGCAPPATPSARAAPRSARPPALSRQRTCARTDSRCPGTPR